MVLSLSTFFLFPVSLVSTASFSYFLFVLQFDIICGKTGAISAGVINATNNQARNVRSLFCRSAKELSQNKVCRQNLPVLYVKPTFSVALKKA
jgi:hypothetical protein